MKENPTTISVRQNPVWGVGGGLVRRRGAFDGQSVIALVCTVDVPSIDEVIATVTRLGGSVALPKMQVSGVGWLAHFKDPEGNIFGAMQEDLQAR